MARAAVVQAEVASTVEDGLDLNRELARPSEFMQARFEQSGEKGAPGAERLTAMFVACDAIRDGGDPLDCNHLKGSIEELTTEGPGTCTRSSIRGRATIVGCLGHGEACEYRVGKWERRI